MRASLLLRLTASAVLLLVAALLTACGGASDAATGNAGEGTPSSIPGAPQPGGEGTQAINHVIFMIQENRSFDTYFGKLNDYRVANGLPAEVDGLPAGASNPSADGSSTVPAFHLKTMCIENVSPSWNESHTDFNRHHPSSNVGTMDGFVLTAAGFAKAHALHDLAGVRAMGYYDWNDLPYYYFMAMQFATSDRWFSPLMSRTQPNRLYSLAATSAGHIRPPNNALSNRTIFHLLEEAGVSWKIYVTDPGDTFLNYFQPFGSEHQGKIVSAKQFASDAANGTLPAVALIESGYSSGLDEHPENHIQKGAAYAASLINALMNSPSWKDSVFFLTYDEGGGIYDHVPPPPAVHPDGIAPIDMVSTDTPGDFNRYGFRVPLLVVSPFARKGYVSHTVADYTAILKFIETRFNLPHLTARDGAQMNMTEFFDFENPPWLNLPTPPNQPTTGPCYQDRLP